MISIYRHAGLRLLGRKKLVHPGIQDELTSWGARVFITPNPYGAAEQARPVYEELGHEVYGIQTDPVFQRVLPKDWVEFYETVYKVAPYSSKSLDEIAWNMFTLKVIHFFADADSLMQRMIPLTLLEVFLLYLLFYFLRFAIQKFTIRGRIPGARWDRQRR